MIYPSVKQYREAIAYASDNLKELNYLSPVMDATGNPYMITGGFAVVFKMQDDDGKLYALKCFTKEQKGREEAYKKIASELDYDNSGYMTKFEYYENELFVDCGDNSVETSVVFMDWVEGVTLDKHLNEDEPDMPQLVYRFSLLTRWLLNATFAHGDIKPDNIIVTPQGNLVLVDYDSMFVPSMAGEEARDQGTPGYSHPLRSTMPFGKHIDDFPLILILFSLKGIALCPELKASGDRILFSAEDLANPTQSETFGKLQPILADAEAMKCYALFMFALSQGNLDGIDDKLTHLKKPEKKIKLATRKKLHLFEGALCGEFSIGPNKKVNFSKGNLQYHCSQKLWRFAKHQYDRIGKDNEYIYSSCDWIDCFAWGTSGFNTKYPNKRFCIVSKKEVDDIAETNYDWGRYNKITNGGNVVGQWRTLGYEEWKFLLTKRVRADELRGFAIVNKIKGLLLFPDNWVSPEGIVFEDGYQYYETNTYTLNEFEKMASNGAVFLPGLWDEFYTAGLAYWSSSGDEDYAIALIEPKKEVFPRISFARAERDYRLSVRLVRDISKKMDFVDLGLSVKWSVCNVWADNPEEYGDSYYYDRAIELNETNIRLPKRYEFQELIDNCVWQWKDNGCLVTSRKNGKSIFFASTGYFDSRNSYWIFSSRRSWYDKENDITYYSGFVFSEKNVGFHSFGDYEELCVRLVCV